MTARTQYERFLKQRHRPAHGRRTAASHAAFLLPHLQDGMRVLDLGCGPASITAGLGDGAVGIDLDPGPSAGVALAAADATRLPFADATFDAVFSCAVMQHLPDPLAALTEARRVCRSGAVIGVADADWGGGITFPDDPVLARGQDILAALRGDASPYVGRQLRQLLLDAGFVRASAAARGVQAGGDALANARQAEMQAIAFESPETIAVVEEEGISSAEEMAAVAAAWRRWAEHPGAIYAPGWWFEAIAWAD